MEKNLYFKSYSKYKCKVLMVSAFSMLFVLLFSSLSFAASIPQKDTIASGQNNTIYISGGATIIGLENTSNIKIAVEENVVKSSQISKAKIAAKAEDHSISAQIIKKEKAAQDKIAKLQKQVDENSTAAFTQIPYSSQINDTTSHQTSKAITNCNNSFKFIIASSQFVLTHKYILEKNKKKFYTPLSYLQFSKYKNSSLRGPPFEQQFT